MTPSPARSLLLPFLLASVCSGGAALLNQVMWTRILSLVFGSTIEAVSAVTAVFMAGLALGSALGPRLAGGRTAAQAAGLYARIELLIGGSALALAFILPALEALRASLGAGLVWPIAILLLLVPAGLMGTTLVVQSHVLAGFSDQGTSARTSGLLFAANTLGAVLGAYGSVLVLVPRLGVRATILVATVLNVTAALLARWRTPSPAQEEKAGKGQPPAAPETPALEPPAAWVILLALFVAGGAGLMNEVAWTRAFILVAGPTVHAFAFVLGAIVLGLFAGALLSSACLAWIPHPRLAFALVQSGVAAASAFVIRSLDTLPLSYGLEVRRLVEQPAALVSLQAERSLQLLFPAAALSGALFPLGLRLLRSRYPAAHAMGFASAFNTTGAILGASLAGFALLPGIGLDRTLRLAACASALSALLVALTGRGAARFVGAGGSVLALAFLSQTPSFDKELFAGGAYKYSAYDPDLSVEDVLRRGELVSYAEGRAANVSVKRIGSSYSLAVDGKVDATSGGDMLTQRLLAHVPFLISEKPEKALVIGLGSGVTAAAALSHDPREVTAVEISPDVVEAARRFFGDANGRVLDHPKLKLVVGDARPHLLGAEGGYDVVISEPSNPWMAGVSALFTREFFTAVKSRLAKDGVFCQWGHLYNMGESDLATLLATFRDVFPSGRVYLISESDILIVGSEGPTSLSEKRLAGIHAAARADLEGSKLSTGLLAAIPTVELSRLSWLDEARRHTDDAPVLDFSAPLSIHAQTATPNRRRLLPVDAPEGALLASRLSLLASSASTEWIYEVSGRAVERGDADLNSAEEYVKSALRLHRAAAAEAVLDAAIQRIPAYGLLVARGLLYWNTDRSELAMASLEAASKLDPKHARAYLLAAEIQSSASNLMAMRQLVGRALAIDGRNAEAIGLAAEAEMKGGRLEPAFRLAEGALRIDPKETRALEVRAMVLAQLGRLAEARNAFLAVLAAEPDASAPRNNFGVFELQLGNAESAARYFKDAVDLDPANEGAYRGLKEAATMLKRDDLIRLADRGIARLAR